MTEDSRDHITRGGDWVIDQMNPVFNPDGTMTLSPDARTVDFFRQHHKIGDKVRFGNFAEPEKLSVCEIVSIGENLLVKPLD